MSGKSEKLSFFCEKCSQPIERNICPSHGIDFVTIKKVAVRTSLQNQQVKSADNLPAAGGLARINSQAAGSKSNGMGIARLDDDSDRPSDGGSALLPLDPDSPPGQPDAEDIYEYTGVPEDSVADNTFTRDNPYRDTDPGVEDYFHPEGNGVGHLSDQPMVVKQSNGMMWAAGALLLVVLAGLGYYFVANSGPSPTALYSQAEAAMDNQGFKEARDLYAAFLQDFPEDPLMPVVREKLSIVERKILNERANTPEGQRRIQQLMLKANIAYNNENYITPLEDNAAQYLKKILRISPNYQPALDMQQKIFDHFRVKAEQVEAEGNLNEALSYYQIMSSLKPNNMDVLAKIQTLLSSGNN